MTHAAPPNAAPADAAPESEPAPAAAPLFSKRVAYALAALTGVTYSSMAPTTVYEVVGDLPWYAGAIAVFAMAFARRPRA